MIHGRTRLLLAFILAHSLACPVAAEVYKWVDEKGVTQYSDNPPAGRAAQPINVSDAPAVPPGAADSKDPMAALRDQENAFQRRRIAREQAECAELARAIVDNKDRDTHLALVAKYNGMCQDRAFDCTTVRGNPGANKCKPALFPNRNVIIRNTAK